MLVIAATDSSHVGECRRAAAATAARLGFPESAAGAAALVATELTTNLIKHAGFGTLYISPFDDDGETGLELLAVDKGPGIADVARSVRDGYSTAGTAGEGLGAIERQSETFEVYSAPGHGAAVLSRIAPSKRARPKDKTVWSGLALPKEGEEACGDAWSVMRRDRRISLIVADGLGHGPLAASASAEACRLFAKNEGLSPAPMVAALHAGLKATRGAAIAVAEIDPDRRAISFCGIGNIAGSVHSLGASRKMASLNGTAGHVARKIAAFDYPYDPAEPALVILHSDGVSNSWSLSDYPGLVHAHPSIIAAILLRDWRRNDDATVAVVRTAAP